MIVFKVIETRDNEKFLPNIQKTKEVKKMKIEKKNLRRKAIERELV